jgi:DUF4097 and DUF4098 domain-containing protein YvlB
MKTVFLALAVALLATGFDTEEKQSIHKTFSGPKSIDIDNVNGNIRVTGYNGSQIEVTADETIRGDDAERAAAARREVKLDMTEDNGELKLYVDGPFRCHCDDGDRRSRHDHDGRRRGYSVRFDFEVKVPQGTKLYLATVNGGEIHVERTSGDYDLDNVNGGIEMKEVAGSGRAHTVNGKIEVTFSRNPERNSSFGSLNGLVEIAFQPGLGADARLKTFNGHVYTDFPVTYLPAAAGGQPEQHNGKFVYHSNDFTGVRFGKGGPEFKFETLNGDIRILRRGQ